MACGEMGGTVLNTYKYGKDQQATFYPSSPMQSSQQIDFVVAPQKFRDGSTASIHEDLACNSDHLPVVAWVPYGGRISASTQGACRNFKRPLTGWVPRDEQSFKQQSEQWWSLSKGSLSHFKDLLEQGARVHARRARRKREDPFSVKRLTEL
eukprot:8609230-Alexandrium_andersonii.AAC.1